MMIENTIYDQASGLRQLSQINLKKIIAITSHQEEETFEMTLGIAINLARKGKKVTMLDANPEDSERNLYPKTNLTRTQLDKSKLQERVIEGPYGLKIISIALNFEGKAKAEEYTQLAHISHFLEYDTEILLIDTG